MKKRTTKKSTSVGGAYPIEDQSWRARDDLSTLQRAQEIAADRARLSAAKREAGKQQQALAKVHKLGSRRI